MTSGEKTNGGDVWFDGVDKKLIEAHSSDLKLIEGNCSTLTTKTPLESFSCFKRKKNEREKAKKVNGGTIETNKTRNELKRIRLQGNRTIKPNSGLTDELALDCEMVECFHHKSVLARVSIVNLFGHPILDRYVAPPAKVTDYRTRYSGIRRKDLVDAPDFETVKKEVEDIIRDRIVVGHAVHNDFGVLKINHPPDKIRDTQNYFKYLFQGKTPSLKKLSESVLGIKIQKGEHDSVQDAQATMKLYVKEREKWNEKILQDKSGRSGKHAKQKTKPQKKKFKTFFVMN